MRFRLSVAEELTGNAMRYLLERYGTRAKLLFVDGWIEKCMILPLGNCRKRFFWNIWQVPCVEPKSGGLTRVALQSCAELARISS